MAEAVADANRPRRSSVRRLASRLRPSTLRGRITAWLIVILVVASAVLGLATALFLKSFLVSRLDQQLSAAGGRYSSSLEGGQNNPGGSDGDADNAVPGQSTGTLGVRLLDGRITEAAVVDEHGQNAVVRFSASDVARVQQVKAGSSPVSVDFSSLGDYRLQAVQGRDGDVQVTGLPLAPVADILGRLLVVEGGVFGVVLLIGGVVTGLMVKRTLRPLAQLTDTASAVSQLPLSNAGTALPRSDIPHDPATEVDRMAVAFGHMLDHIRAALLSRDATEARLRTFIADASHELRTPLATISANAEFIGRRDASSLAVDSQQALGRITSASERMSHLVSDLLLLARLDAGRPLARDDVDLTWLVLETVDEARVAGPSHRWRLDVHEEVITVSGDADRLRQVLANLLTNARLHTPPGTGVTTRLAVDDSGVCISVCDDGPGIPIDQQADIFDRFTRGDRSRDPNHGNTGLGLAIARSIVSSHGGTICVRHHENGGACFEVRLPL